MTLKESTNISDEYTDIVGASARAEGITISSVSTLGNYMWKLLHIGSASKVQIQETGDEGP